MNKLFLLCLFLTLSNISRASMNELPYQIEYSLIDSLAFEEDTANNPIDDSVWMMGNREADLRVYKGVLYNNTLVKLVFNDGRESEKGLFIKMLNEDSLLFETQGGLLKTIALKTITRIRKNLTSRKLKVSLVFASGVAMISSGMYILYSNPTFHSIGIGGGLAFIGIGLVLISPLFLIQERYNPKARYFAIVKISKDQLNNSSSTKHAMNSALRAQVKANIAAY